MNVNAPIWLSGRWATSAPPQERGGHPISVTMDHGEDAEVEQLFARIRAEQRGRLDILVNNAYAGVATIFSSVGETRYSR